jgi:hypothetical protein
VIPPESDVGTFAAVLAERGVVANDSGREDLAAQLAPVESTFGVTERKTRPWSSRG